MPEIGTSGLMSGDGKQGDTGWPKPLRPSSTLPLLRESPRLMPFRSAGQVQVAQGGRDSLHCVAQTANSGSGGRRSARCRSAAGYGAARFGCTGLSTCGVAVVIGTMVLLEAGVASAAGPGTALEAGPEGSPVPGGGLGDDQGDATGVAEDAAADAQDALAEAAQAPTRPGGDLHQAAPGMHQLVGHAMQQQQRLVAGDRIEAGGQRW